METKTKKLKKQFTKTWVNGEKTTYSKFEDKVLTRDGVLLSYEDFDKMNYKDYIIKLNSLNTVKYDYQKSVRSNKLYPTEKPNTSIITDKYGNTFNVISQKKKRGRPKGSKNKPKVEPKLVDETVKVESVKEKKSVFLISTKIIMLILTIGTAILSIYFTGEKMKDISNSTWIGYLISTIMYLYGLLGSNFALVLKNHKRKLSYFVVLSTSILTIIFSMCTSLLVNGDRYYNDNYVVEETSTKNFESNKLRLETINEQINSTKEMIEWYKDDTKAFNENHTKWESSGASKTTKESINKLNSDLEKLYNEKSELLKETPDIVNENSKNVASFTQMISVKLHFDGNLLYIFLLLFSSVFIDLIGPLCLYMVRFNK